MGFSCGESAFTIQPKGFRQQPAAVSDNSSLGGIKSDTLFGMRKQYYFSASDRGLLSWDVDHLVELSKDLPRRHVPLTELRTLDEPWTGGDEKPTWRAMLEHVRLINEADPSHPFFQRSVRSWMGDIAV